jgi:sugar phosphate permease
MGPCYVLGHVGSWLLTGWLVARWGWRAAFLVPAALVAVSALHWLVRIRNAPQDVGLASPVEPNDALPAGWGGARGVLQRTFAQPRLRWATLVITALGLVQGSAILWVPTYLVDKMQMGIGGAAVGSVVLPLFGLAGVVVAGWASDRFFGSRVAPMTALMMAGLAASVIAARFLIPAGGGSLAVLMLGLLGVTSYGANSILVTVLPLSLSREGGVSSAAGLLDFASYVGAGAGGLLSGALLERWGWDAVFACWIVAAMLGLICTPALSRSER